MLEQYRKQTDLLLLRQATAQSAYRTERKALKVALRRQAAILQAQKIAQQVAKQIQEQAHRKIAGVVTRSLETVLDKPYTFQISFEQKRGRTEAILSFEREGLTVDPMTAAGGGVMDVAAFSLRLSCMLLSRPPVRRLIVLDEPFKFVSAGLRGRVRTLLHALTEELGIQIIMVTHINELKTGTVYKIGEEE